MVSHPQSLAGPVTLAGHLTSVPVALSCRLTVLSLLAAGRCRAEQAGGDSGSSEELHFTQGFGSFSLSLTHTYMLLFLYIQYACYSQFCLWHFVWGLSNK